MVQEKTAAAWSAAEANPSAAAWEAAATAYEGERDACTGDGCTDAAFAAVLARKKAFETEPPPPPPPPGDDPAELPARVRTVVEAIDAYVATVDPTDPDLPGLRFTAASAMYTWRQPDAIARLEALLREHRDDPTAEYAANQLIDLLLRTGQIAEARAWAVELLADAAFMVGKDALRATLERVREVTAPK